MRLLVALLAVFALSFPTAVGQVAPCPFQDDGLFTGGCCDLVQPRVPDFPSFGSDALWLCLTDCRIADRARAEFGISAPSWVDCDRVNYDARFRVQYPGGVNIDWGGSLQGKYSRTFWQVSSTGRRYQVWRFLVNGDFRPSASLISTNSCRIPSTAGIFGRVHFVGHVDYACAANGGYDTAVSLQHLPGCISHGSLSVRPAGPPQSQPDKAWYLVAPGSFSAGANQGTEPQGTIVGEESRESTPVTSRGCYSENNIRHTSIRSIHRDCPCVGGNPSMPWVVQETALIPYCQNRFTQWKPYAVGPSTVPAGLNLQVVGQWSVPADTYPERQTLIHYQAFVVTNDQPICNQQIGQRQFLTGVGMKGNRTYSFHPSIIATPYDNAIDLCNHVDPANGAFYWGAPSIATLQFGLFVQ